MGKLVILKLGGGNFEQGFPVTLQIGDEGSGPSVELTGNLPAAPQLPERYTQWRSTYRSLSLSVGDRNHNHSRPQSGFFRDHIK